MTDPVNRRILKCRTSDCATKSNQAPARINKLPFCEMSYSEASEDRTRGIFKRWNKEDDSKKRPLEEAQAKGMMICVCQIIKIN